jgi:deazaflavin-dependent oxidoreductase (nitroreductase family)
MTTDARNPETEEREPDNAAALAWEEALIADLRANNGVASGGPLAGQSLVILYTTGAKSGLQRRSILTPSRQDGDLVVAGSASGSKVDPAWIANIRANPKVTLEAGGETYDATGSVFAEGAERDRLWAEHVAQLPWFAEYPAQVGSRTIPLARLRRS